MTDKLKFIESTLFNPAKQAKKILVPIEAIASLEKEINGSGYIVHFRPDYNFGTKEPIDSINASMTSESIEILK